MDSSTQQYEKDTFCDCPLFGFDKEGCCINCGTFAEEDVSVLNKETGAKDE